MTLHLTPREKQLTEILTSGIDNVSVKHLARLTGMAEGTVKCHLADIYIKMRVTNRTALVARLLRRDEDDDDYERGPLSFLRK